MFTFRKHICVYKFPYISLGVNKNLVLLLAAIITAFLMETSKCTHHELLHANSLFASNMYKILSEEQGNVFFSPISIHAVLSMAYQGAANSTAKAFESTLSLTNPQKTAEGYNQLMNQLNSVRNATLNMANKIYVKENVDLLDGFKRSVVEKFLSETETIDFTDSNAVGTINAWVEQKTNSKITNLFQSGDFDDHTMLVLINAIYFKGSWSSPFGKNATRSEAFFLNDTDTIDVAMMHMKHNFRYKEDATLNAKILSMPYSEGDLSMIVVLPNERNGIKNLEEKLAGIGLSEISENMRSTEVVVTLPKFKVEKAMDLKGTLEKMGLGEIFNESKANFSRIIPEPQLYVSKVVQKAFVEVNEEGSEAAAATVGHVLKKRSLLVCEEFVADHPFIYFVLYKTNILFCGRLSEFRSNSLAHDEL